MFAEFETAIRRGRQLEGIAKAKAEGIYKGRKPSIDAHAVRALASEGFGGTEIARELKIGRASVYRLLAQARACTQGLLVWPLYLGVSVSGWQWHSWWQTLPPISPANFRDPVRCSARPWIASAERLTAIPRGERLRWKTGWNRS